MNTPSLPNPPFLSTVLRMRCPRCGRGKLFEGFLKVRPMCTVCDFDLSKHEHGDGPAFFAIILVGFLVTGTAGYVEYAYQPPLWLHALLWLPAIIGLSFYSLHLFKAAIIAAQYRYKKDQFDL